MDFRELFNSLVILTQDEMVLRVATLETRIAKQDIVIAAQLGQLVSTELELKNLKAAIEPWPKEESACST